MKKLNKVNILKTIVFAISLFFLTGAVYAQSINVPAKVQSAFNKKFPHAKKVKWSKENAHEYEADFMVNGQKYSTDFKPNGKWIEAEKAISVSALPSNIRKAFMEKYPNARILGVSYVLKPMQQQFEIDAQVKGKRKEFVYSARGKLLSHSSKMGK